MGARIFVVVKTNSRHFQDSSCTRHMCIEMETSENSQEPSTSTSEPLDPTTDSVYRSFSTYPFDADQEYQSGLAAILGHPETPATHEELRDKSAVFPSTTELSSTTSSAAPAEPPYPTSF